MRSILSLLALLSLISAHALAEDAEKWTSKSGRKFLSVSGKRIAFCVTELSTKDFSEFVRSTNFVTTAELSHLNQFKVPADSKHTWRVHVEQPDKPVVNVSIADAIAFTKWLSELEKVTYRLPTAVEWHDFAEVIQPKASKLQSIIDVDHGESFIGVYHLLGNVRELCDEFAPISRPSELIERNNGIGILVSVRGGAWHSSIDILNIDCKDYIGIENFDKTTGFRVIAELDGTLERE